MRIPHKSALLGTACILLGKSFLPEAVCRLGSLTIEEPLFIKNNTVQLKNSDSNDDSK